MNDHSPNGPGFFTTLRILLRSARHRSRGRQTRQQQLLKNRSGGSSADWSGVGSALTAVFMIALNCLAAAVTQQAVEAAQRLDVLASGKIVVDSFFLESAGYLNPKERQSIRAWVFAQEAQNLAARCGGSPDELEQKLREAYEKHGTQDFFIAYQPNICAGAADQGKIAVSSTFYREVAAVERANRYRLGYQKSIDSSIHIEARSISQRYGGDPAAIERQLHDTIAAHGVANLVSRDQATPGVSGLPRSGPIARLAGSLVLCLWFVMLVFQGEGLELDLQRRRHPMWEWLFSHPVPSGAVFLAEMLAPAAANPIYWGAPLYAGVLFGLTYGFSAGALATLLAGIPIAIAAAALGKACEIATVLRFPPRTRGAITGIMSWLGYALMMLFFLGLVAVPKAVTTVAPVLRPLSHIPAPWLSLFLGQFHAESSLALGILTCITAAALTIAGSVWFSVWAMQQGLAGNFSAAASRPSRAPSAAAFGREPLYRKEFLWFVRDRSAIVQTILIPITLAATQAFNLRGILNHAQGSWNYLCGAAIFFGTYFLWVLGPKSLSSEGSALWIALTWPRGLESLLRAKAWLWSLLSTSLVSIVLVYAAVRFPPDIPRILILGVAWFLFARSMAEKSVTLVTVTSESGEPQKIDKGRRWAAQLGMLTFAIGVLTQQWQIAVMGIVYSWITAAAMWQNFRARLPYLYDPWSETLPPPPTLMHAMIAISILVEAGAVVTGILLVVLGAPNIAIAKSLAYALCAVAVSIGTRQFLSNRGVRSCDILCWQSSPDSILDDRPWHRRYLIDTALPQWLLAALAGGAVLAAFAHAYTLLLARLPATSDAIRHSQQLLASNPSLRISYFIAAVCFAPFAEEYLFRGLLFRALDVEWGGWRAILGSAAFFAIYHPPLAWPPVFLVGAANALLFRKSRTLAPAILLHLTYNAIVLTWR